MPILVLYPMHLAYFRMKQPRPSNLLGGSAVNADWLTAMVYQTIYHRYDKTFIFTALITLVTSNNSNKAPREFVIYGHGLCPGTPCCVVRKNIS
jgi:hypothetical protein